MKTTTKMILIIAFVIAIGISFFVGSHLKEQQNLSQSSERCKTYISFALDKAENKDLTDDGVMKGLISNVYAAYTYCDNTALAGQLHDLWNELIFEADIYMENKDMLVSQLESIAEALKC